MARKGRFEAERQQINNKYKYLSSAEEKNTCKPRLLYPVNLSFKSEGTAMTKNVGFIFTLYIIHTRENM